MNRKFSFLRPYAGIALPLLFALAALNSCKQADLFEKNTVIPDYKWQSGFAAKGSFSITDTSSAYTIYIVLRHTDAYRYNNIWLSTGIQPPGDSMYFNKLNLALGTDAEGWEGVGMNDIWELRKPVIFNRHFKVKGEYRFSISQIMRDDPLTGVMSAGLRIEKQAGNP